MSSTLRVAPKGDKPSPRIVFRYGSQDHGVKDFLRYRKLIKRIHKEALKSLRVDNEEGNREGHKEISEVTAK